MKIKDVFRLFSRVNPYLLAVLFIGFTALLCLPLSGTRGYHVVSFILLFVVSLLATFLGIGPIFLAATLSALVWNFFFIPPHFTFHIERTDDILMFLMFFTIAILNGVLTTRISRQERLAREREIRTEALFLLTSALSKASGMNEVLAVAISEINKSFGFAPFFILQDGNEVLLQSGRLQKNKELNPQEYDIAKWVFVHFQKAGKFCNAFPNEKYCYYPLPGARVRPGVVVLEMGNEPLGEKEAYWETFLALISNALEREFLGEMAQKVRFLDESDRLYKTLFNSISHELRIPVATIMGSADALISSNQDEHIQKVLFTEMFTASLRLNRLIENLLNMSRLESGRITARLDWYDINDLFNKVTQDLDDELKPFHLKVNLQEDLPLVKIDFGLMEQVLYNLIFNACQNAPAATIIGLEASYGGDELVVLVWDQGPGFLSTELRHAFDKFYRVNRSKTGGLGLGLSIVKGFVEAHKGFVYVENRESGGALFTIKIPSGSPEILNMQFDET